MRQYITIKLIATYVLASLISNAAYASDTESAETAVQILKELRETKTLTLASGSKFYVEDPRSEPATTQPGSIPFARISIRAPGMINEFGFTAELTRMDQPTCIMKVASRKDGAVVIVETADGQPYCLMAKSMLVLCDPENSGGLSYYEGGSTLWGFYQIPEDPNGALYFQMTFAPTNVPSGVFLDVDNILRQTLIDATNTRSKTPFDADNQTLTVETDNFTTEMTLASGSTTSSFGIKKLALRSSQGAGLAFSNFQMGTTQLEGLFDLTKQDVEKLGLPMRELTEDDFTKLEVLPRKGPISPEKQKVSAQLKALIESRCKSTTTQMAPISDEATAPPASD